MFCNDARMFYQSRRYARSDRSVGESAPRQYSRRGWGYPSVYLFWFRKRIECVEKIICWTSGFLKLRERRHHWIITLKEILKKRLKIVIGTQHRSDDNNPVKNAKRSSPTEVTLHSPKYLTLNYETPKPYFSTATSKNHSFLCFKNKSLVFSFKQFLYLST